MSSGNSPSSPKVMPPVSVTKKRRSSHFASSLMRSRVIPGWSPTIARRLWVSRLKRVDFPTLGRPTTTRMGKGFDKTGLQTASGRGLNAAPYLDDTVRDAMRLRAVNDRLKVEHSIIDGLRPVLETLLADNEAIASIVPGVIRKVRKA